MMKYKDVEIHTVFELRGVEYLKISNNRGRRVHTITNWLFDPDCIVGSPEHILGDAQNIHEIYAGPRHSTNLEFGCSTAPRRRRPVHARRVADLCDLKCYTVDPDSPFRTELHEHIKNWDVRTITKLQTTLRLIRTVVNDDTAADGVARDMIRKLTELEK